MSGSAYDCVVIGGGIVGAATARALAARGNRILLLERAMPGAEASGAAAGMLTPQVEVLPDDPLLPLAIAALTIAALKTFAVLSARKSRGRRGRV